MRRFESFIGTKDLRKVSPDPGLAESLTKDAQQRSKLILQLPLSKESATLVFEQIYESLRQCIDALLALKGYKSYSHVASIAFLQTCKEFSEGDIQKMDNAREKRNLAKYYAKQVEVTETQDLIVFYHQIKPRLDALYQQVSGTQSSLSPSNALSQKQRAPSQGYPSQNESTNDRHSDDSSQ